MKLYNKKFFWFFFSISVTLLLVAIFVWFLSSQKNKQDIKQYCGFYICAVHNTKTKREYRGVSIISKKKAIAYAMQVCRNNLSAEFCTERLGKCKLITKRNMQTG